MCTIAVVRFMYFSRFDMVERPGMLVLEVPHDRKLKDVELLEMVRHRGYNVTRIIKNEDAETEWVMLTEDMFH
ncbi:hypothetical protein [Lysinibacillus odysseyi]|uniref:Uncharacterized protein n=1 Tax=Lysinibacillus odysseyi 34hs-1 = NBRC 100172 TaxID=1220589 RepID=A0A0A3IY71_9BACI|nr:hypothetical protein [Lysinibacillus odysseyi]KGR88390.1 hypothetical protein CD32_01630 [Lysinibacillus odysseyi 34hs-1 = NBRC 100172]